MGDGAVAEHGCCLPHTSIWETIYRKAIVIRLCSHRRPSLHGRSCACSAIVLPWWNPLEDNGVHFITNFLQIYSSGGHNVDVSQALPPPLTRLLLHPYMDPEIETTQRCGWIYTGHTHEMNAVGVC